MAVFLPKIIASTPYSGLDAGLWGSLTLPSKVLPASEVEVPQLSVPPALRAAIEHTGKAILLVEDDLMVSLAISHLFESLQLPVLIAADPRTARALSGRAFVAACDVRLPGQTSGLDLAIELETTYAIPCLLMTGETSAEIKVAAQLNGLPLLIKPIKPQALLDGLALMSAALGPVRCV